MYDERSDTAGGIVSADETALTRLAARRKKNIARITVFVLALVVVTVIVFSSQSLAYFTDMANSFDNRISAGNVGIDIMDMMSDGQGGPVLYTDPIKVMPASSVSKVVAVKNSGSLAVYVRISLKKTVNDPTDLAVGWEDKISCNINSADWQLVDGYYYYTKALRPGQTTTPLFDEVSFAASMGNEFVNKSVVFTVTAQAVQAGNNGTGAPDAAGWPS